MFGSPRITHKHPNLPPQFPNAFPKPEALRIELSDGRFALIDSSDAEKVLSRTWTLKPRDDRNGFYAVSPEVRDGKRTQIRMHRFIIDAEPDVLVDHRNGDGLDNRRENIRKCSREQNNRNRRPGANLKGAHFCGEGRRKPWKALIRVDGKNFYLGHFESEHQAALAYDEAALKYFGEFANLNFPRGAA